MPLYCPAFGSAWSMVPWSLDASVTTAAMYSEACTHSTQQCKALRG